MSEVMLDRLSSPASDIDASASAKEKSVKENKVFIEIHSGDSESDESDLKSTSDGSSLSILNPRKRDLESTPSSHSDSGPRHNCTSPEDEEEFEYTTSFGSSSGEDLTPKKSLNVVLIGDEMIEVAGDLVCRTDFRNITRVCLPGATISDFIENLDRIVCGEDVAFLHIGTNDIPTKMVGNDLSRYRTLISKCKERCYTVVMGLIPRWDFYGRWLNRSRYINKKIKELCQELGVEFIDVWPKFETRFDYFDSDGFFLNRVGVRLLADIITLGINKARSTFQSQDSKAVSVSGSIDTP